MLLRVWRQEDLVNEIHQHFSHTHTHMHTQPPGKKDSSIEYQAGLDLHQIEVCSY